MVNTHSVFYMRDTVLDLTSDSLLKDSQDVGKKIGD